MINKSLKLTVSRPLHLSELRGLVELAEREAMSPDSSVSFTYPEDGLVAIVVTDVSETA